MTTPGENWVTVDSHSRCTVLTIAAEICGLQQRREIGGQPNDDGVEVAAIAGLGPSNRARKIRGVRETGNVHLARPRVDSKG